MYNIISITCIFALTIIVLYFTITIFRKFRNRGQRIDFVRQFKKGNCVIVYLVAIPLYWIGYVYSGQDILSSFFNSINKTMTLVVLRYDISSVSGLLNDNVFYKVAIYYCFFVVLLNAMLFALSCLHQKIWEWYQTASWKYSKKDKLLIVGNNEGNVNIYSTKKQRKAIVIDNLSKEEKENLYGQAVAYFSSAKKTDIGEYCCATILKCFPNQNCTIVINTQDDEKNIALCLEIIACTKHLFEEKNDSQKTNFLNKISVYVFGMPDQETIYNKLAEESNGYIRYINKYRQIAMDFVDRYPLTQFMTEEYVDYKTSLLKDDIDINVVMIGFGKTNQQIFLTSIANNQFLTCHDNQIVLNPVHYYIFDKQHLENNKNLNHSYSRFKNEFLKESSELLNSSTVRSEYLPIPDLPADTEHFDKLDIHDPAFYKKLRSTLEGKGRFNYVIVAFGDDLENIDMAQKLLDKKNEWELKDTYIFVKVRSGDCSLPVFAEKECFIIGDEKNAVFNMDHIDDNAITSMAKMRNRIYKLESRITSYKGQGQKTSVKDVYDEADVAWYMKKTQLERESNLYACLSLRSKLHLMGLDYCSMDQNINIPPLSNDEYMSRYAEDDVPEYYSDEILADGKKIVKYGLDFVRSRRNTMAIHEHYRWNSYMISKGFIPASKKEILEDKISNGKDYKLRRHGNLTTFDGLVEFRKMISDRDGVDELTSDVIKYDYQLLDDAYWLLSSNNYKIIDRTK